jgi:ubiquinone/menaquinone biosynthesis C-methylase UbiE
LNLAGEGEVPEAIDINSLVFPRQQPHLWVRPGRFIQGDITALPVREAIAIEVIGRGLPTMSHEDRIAVVREAHRVLAPGGTVRLHASSGSGALWLPFLATAGFLDGRIKGIFAVGMRRHD